MRISCNGCRVLRKGCGENCSLRPCLAWIKTPKSQANATMFLSQFYGRTGLINLINSGPEDLRPEIFRSLLQDACGRIVNPVSGSAGLSLSGRWGLCQAAVEAVLRGDPITPIASDSPPIESLDIPDVDKDDISAASDRIPSIPRQRRGTAATADETNRSSSHDSSSLSHQSESAAADGESEETRSDTEAAGVTRLLFPVEPTSRVCNHHTVQARECRDVELGPRLRLGPDPEPEPATVEEPRAYSMVPVKKRRLGLSGTCVGDSSTCKVETEL